MQILKGDHNRQMRKDEETNLRKMNLQESIAQKLKTSLLVRPLRWGVVGNTMTGINHGCPDGVPCNTQSIKRDWGKGRGQGPGAKDLHEGRTLMMTID